MPEAVLLAAGPPGTSAAQSGGSETRLLTCLPPGEALAFAALHQALIGLHLFPSMPRPRLRLARPTMRAYCRELGIPYTETGLVNSHRQVLRHLYEVGQPLRDE
ncbi:hypothetical protein GCM10023084_46510 [Streptomyces lacrimifluminis]|uniref:Uncharacterized protein n=1 Tax=Streptomyces lacrimifluminis TaxID=1500077 RepID=A0A917P2A3_9ACTN|nr:hypothetical protein GCM10012282_51290 [Streptomyces lacrimifluminis]